MQPASRTPEGEPNQCPICGKEVRLEPSRPPGDAPCPNCGHLLWFSSSACRATPSIDPPEHTIRAWTNHVAQASDNQYFKELVSGLVKYMGARRGVIWTMGTPHLRRTFQHEDANFPETPSDWDRSNNLVQLVAVTGKSLVGQPNQESGSGDCGHMTSNSLLLVAPVKRGLRTVAIIEIAQEPGAAVELWKSNLRFLEKICELTNERISKIVDAYSTADAVAVGSSDAAMGKKRWWEVWKK